CSERRSDAQTGLKFFKQNGWQSLGEDVGILKMRSLYCLGKDNGENIMKSIKEGPFQMGTVSDVIAGGTEGAVQQGPNFDNEREKHSRARLEIQGYELALESLESRILRHEKNELAWGEKYEFQNYELKCRELKINNLNIELEKVVKERQQQQQQHTQSRRSGVWGRASGMSTCPLSHCPGVLVRAYGMSTCPLSHCSSVPGRAPGMSTCPLSHCSGASGRALGMITCLLSHCSGFPGKAP
ncbi:hypothetical protein Tco_0813692, partial [Tanacetum coccineum]